MPRITADARRVPPDEPHERTFRERLLNAGIVFLFGFFLLCAVVWLIDLIALSNH